MANTVVLSKNQAVFISVDWQEASYCILLPINLFVTMALRWENMYHSDFHTQFGIMMPLQEEMLVLDVSSHIKGLKLN